MELSCFLGAQTGVESGIAYLDETDVQFVAGKTIVRYDSETRVQNIVHGAGGSLGISAIAVTPNRRTIAIAERLHDGSNAVYVMEWASKKKRRLTSIDANVPTVTHLRFSGDGHTLLVQTGAPDWSLRLVLWEKGAGGKVIGTINNVPPGPNRPVTGVDFCPADPNLLAAVGKGFYRLFRFVEGAVKTTTVNLKRDPASITTEFTAQAWLSEDRQVAGSASGELFLISGSELIRMIESPQAGPTVMQGTAGPRPITTLTPFSKGFIAGCEGGIVRVYERQDDAAAPFRCTRSLSLSSPLLSDDSPVEGLAISPTEEDMAVLTKAGQMHHLKLATIEGSRVVLDNGNIAPFRPLIAPFHSLPLHEAVDESQANSAAAVIAAATGKNRGFQDIPTHKQGINSLSLCVRKPLFATAGCDKFVRVWNYSGSFMGGAALASGHAGEGSTGTGGAGGMEGASTFEATPVLELSQQFKEIPTAVALHPSGNLIAIGLETTLQLCSLVLGTNTPVARVLKEYPVWHATDVAFSNGGGLLAAAAGTSITIISPWTGANVATLRGHGDKVVAIAWSKDDRCLVSTSKDGVVIRWAVSVPNAATAGGSAVAALSAMAGGSVSLPGVAHDAPMDRRGSVSAPPPPGPSLIGTVLSRVELKDFTPTALALAGHESGRDAIVTGVIVGRPASPIPGTKGSGFGSPQTTFTPVLRHVALDASAGGVVKDKEKEVRMAEPHKDGAQPEVASPEPTGKAADPVRALAALLSSKLIVAGIGRVTPPGSVPRASSPGFEPGSREGATAPGSHSKAGTLSRTGTVASNQGRGTAGSPSKPGRAGEEQPAETHPAPHVEADRAGNLRLMRLPQPSHGAAHSHDNSSSSRASKDGIVADAACHAAPVLRVAVSRDEKLVISAAADGSIALWHVADSNGERPQATTTDRLPLSDTILASKGDVDGLRKDRASLEAKLMDVTVQARKAERAKAEANEARMAELQAKFRDEIEAARQRTAELLSAKSRMETQSEGQIASLSTSQSKELTDLEAAYSGKVGGELGRYDKLVAERDKSARDAQAAAESMESRQALEVEELKARYEALLAEEEAAVAALEVERATIAAQSVKAAHGLEKDVEGELSQLRTRYEMRLAAESKATLLLRGENGFMKRKFVGINRDISEQKDELSALAEKEKELNDAIANLTKDVAGHKKEIREREDTITDKDNRIYELKKKNQELEKFKFVLNYKIQELKRQILPRKKEIADMREQLKEMEMELLQYHKSNAALDLMIGELKLKRDGIARDVTTMEATLDVQDKALARIARDLVAVAGAESGAGMVPGSSIALKALRSSIVQLYAKYIHNEESGMRNAMAELGATLRASASDGKEGGLVVPPGVNVEELADELARQRHHLERNVESVAKKIAAEEAGAATDRARLLRENTALTQEVNDLRRDLRFIQADLAAARSELSTVELLSATGSLAAMDKSHGQGSTTNTLAASNRPGATLRRTGALQGVVTAPSGQPGSSGPIGLVVGVKKLGQDSA